MTTARDLIDRGAEQLGQPTRVVLNAPTEDRATATLTVVVTQRKQPGSWFSVQTAKFTLDGRPISQQAAELLLKAYPEVSP